MLFASLLQSQSNNLSVTLGNISFSKSVMTSSIDTAIVAITKHYPFITIAAVCSVGADTLQIWTLQNNGAMWIQHAVIDLSSNTATAGCILSTTRKEFLLLDPQPNQIMIISPSDDASIDTVMVQGKFGTLGR
jgi:hypothetical protein